MGRSDKVQGSIRNLLWGDLPAGHDGKIPLGHSTVLPIYGKVHENTTPTTTGLVTAYYSLPFLEQGSERGGKNSQSEDVGPK